MARIGLRAPSEQGRLAFEETGQSAFLFADEIYYTTFTTLNGPDITGYAVLGYDEQTGRLAVSIRAEGLEPNQTHVQHIHGFMPGDDGITMDSMIPTIDDDTDGDGFIELGEGAPVYGGILLGLQSDGNMGNGNFDPDTAMFPMVGDDGRLVYDETFRLPEGDLSDDPMLALREIVLHGLTLGEGDGDNGGEADGTAGYKATLPVAAGELELADDADELQDAFDGFVAPPMNQPTALGQFAANLTGESVLATADEFYFASFTDLNGSGVDGNALVAYDVETSMLTVVINASGLEANEVHAQHIHGFLPDDMGNVADTRIPTLDDDDDGDGFIEVSEGADAYGAILLGLMGDDGDPSTDDEAMFPTADADGNLYFIESYTLPAGELGEDPMLGLRELVLHGLTLEPGEGANGGEADGSGGYVAALPVAAAQLNEVGSISDLTAYLAIDAFTDADLNSPSGVMLVTSLSDFA